MKFAQVSTKSKMPLSLYNSRVRAGFPSPAEDYEDKKLDLNDFLIQHPASTFFVRVEGESMTGAGLYPGDMLVVDRYPTPKSGDVILAVVDGDFTVKRFVLDKKRIILEADNPKYDSIILQEGQEFQVWGVVVASVRFPSQGYSNPS